MKKRNVEYPISNKELLRSLIKEGNHNIQTYTKIGSDEKICNEVRGILFFRSMGFNTPEIVSSAADRITIKLIRGISVFKALEILSKRRNKQDLVFKILDELCFGVRKFQEKSRVLDLDFQPYDIVNKLKDIIMMLSGTDLEKHNKIDNISSRISSFFLEKAHTPFRDANPKNYIFEDINNENIDELEDSYKKRLFYIDFSTFNRLTLQSDDLISILFHYMIDNDLRDDLFRKYHVDLNSHENIVSGFVRIGRFWVRRQYYKKYAPELFRKRYASENLSFYNKIMDQYLEKLMGISDNL